VEFPEALDHAMLRRALHVVDPAGANVEGEVHVARGERAGSFIPNHTWSSGTYVIRIERTLEDLAGNSGEPPGEGSSSA